MTLLAVATTICSANLLRCVIHRSTNLMTKLFARLWSHKHRNRSAQHRTSKCRE